MAAIDNRALYELISSRKLPDIENYLNNNKIDINTIVYYTYSTGRHPFPIMRHIMPQGTLMEIAVERKDLNVINYLLKTGADINKSGQDNKTSLSRAVEEDKLEIVKLLISKGADVNLIHPNDGNTPLATSIRYGRKEIAKYLINIGVNIFKIGKNGKKPLVWAVENNDLEIVTELLDHAVEAEHAIHTSFMRAIELQHFEIVQLLRHRGALINCIYKNGYTPLTMAISLYSFEIVKELIQNGADVNMNDLNGNCPLIRAIQMGNFEIVKSIIDSGADLNIISESGCSPLILAIQKENFEMVKYLVEKGVDVNELYDKKSSLLFAAANYNIPIFKLLINSGADLNSVIKEIEEIASDDEDFFIYFNSLKENMKKVSDIKSGVLAGHEQAST